MPSRRRGIFRQVVSGLVVLGLLLLSVSSLSAMPTSHSPSGHGRSASLMWEVVTSPAYPDCSGDSCMDHDNSGDMCCAGAVCMLVPEPNVFALAAPTLVRYCNNGDISLGQTREPDLGPPILQE
jgi:hypothetical protein